MPKSDLYWRIADKYRAQEKAMNKTPTQTPEEWIVEETERMQLAAERQAVEALETYWENQQAESRFKSEKEACGLIIKGYLQTHDMTELADMEKGYKAVLQPRKLPNENWDVSAMDSELILRLAKAGCLVVDKKAMDLKSHQALRMDADPYFIPAGETVALKVIKE